MSNEQIQNLGHFHRVIDIDFSNPPNGCIVLGHEGEYNLVFINLIINENLTNNDVVFLNFASNYNKEVQYILKENLQGYYFKLDSIMERAGTGEIQFYIKRIEEVVNPETQETEEVATVIATSNKIPYIVKEALGEGNIAGGITQEQVNQIEQYIAGFQTKANITDVYTKTQTDNLLEDKADAADVYTKTEADAGFASKASFNTFVTETYDDDMTDLEDAIDLKANSSDVAAALALKADAADVAAKMADKMDNFPLPFLPVRVYKDQYCDGWVNWGGTTSPTYGDPHFSTLAGCIGFILPVKGHKGIMTWKVNTTKNNQVVVLNSNLKRVENKAPAIIGSIASLNLATDPNFKTKSFDYIAFATTDINSITFKEMLSSEGFYINPANTRYEIYNDEPVLAQFNPPYLYSDETPLYIYPQALFNRPFKMVSNPSGHNSLIQNGHDGFNLFNVTDLPTKTKVTIANGKKVLFIGDSYTNHRIYVKYVYDTITALNKEITLLGSWGEGVYRHEGRSGWRNYTFAKCSNQTDDSAFSGGTSIPNPFYNPDPSVKQFDFGFYVTNKLNGVCPDIVFVNLGANDMSRGDYNTESDICEFVNIIVSSIKNYNSNIKVVYWLPNQFPIGINSGYDRWEGTTEYCRIIMNNYIELGIDELCPIRYAFDCYNDGRYVTQNINGHDMILLSDTTHPSELGYQHIGQMIIPYIHNY